MRKLLYNGSVKNLWTAPGGALEFEFTDAYSVFDWGRMPDKLNGKGEALAGFGQYFFEKITDPETWSKFSKQVLIADVEAKAELKNLCQQGMRNHFIRRLAPNGFMVEQVETFKPRRHSIGNQVVYDYAEGIGKQAPKQLIPLEVVFRFGIPKGSSLLERLTPQYASELGFSEIPKQEVLFEKPIIEFFSKFEQTDRFLTWEQAFNYSGLTWDVFVSLLARTKCLAFFLFHEFKKVGLELWDGKFEWAQYLQPGKPPELVLADSIGPDELRLLDPQSKVQVSKEFLRQFYRQTPWYQAVIDAKAEAKKQGTDDWKKKVLEKVGPPPPLNPAFKTIATSLYPSLALAVTGENPGGKAMPLAELIRLMRQGVSA